jgi:hypothetical protein
VSALVDEHRAQVLNYLSTTGCKLGLLVNFGHYQNSNTSACSPDRTNHRMFISEILAYFRVFRGQIAL